MFFHANQMSVIHFSVPGISSVPSRQPDVCYTRLCPRHIKCYFRPTRCLHFTSVSQVYQMFLHAIQMSIIHFSVPGISSVPSFQQDVCYTLLCPRHIKCSFTTIGCLLYTSLSQAYQVFLHANRMSVIHFSVPGISSVPSRQPDILAPHVQP